MTGPVLIGVAVIGVIIAAIVAYASRLDGNGGHTRRAVARREAAAGFPSRDDSDFATQLRPPGRFPYIISDTDEPSEPDEPSGPDWWYHPDPDPTQAGLHAVNTWGGTPAEQADYLYAQNFGARYLP